MESDTSINQPIHARRSSETKIANVDPNQYYLVENTYTKQRHVITHLFVKYDPTGMSNNVQCKTTPRGTRFEAKILLQGHKNECERKLDELRTLTTPTKKKTPMEIVDKSSNQSSMPKTTPFLKQVHPKKQKTMKERKLPNTTDQNLVKKKHQPDARRRKLFGSNNSQPLFEISNSSPASTSSLTRTSITNINKSTSNSNRPPSIAKSTISNISSTLEKSSTDGDQSESDEYSTEEENEKTLPTTQHVCESTSDTDDEVQLLLNKEKSADLDQLQIKYDKLLNKYNRLKDKFSKSKAKYTQLEQNTIPKPPAPAHEWLIQLGRLCDAKPTPVTCEPIAKALDINVSDLINLIGGSKTQTARNIMHLKLTAHEKATWTHKNVPKTWRTAIHDFIRIIVTGEPYNKYKINEAINGCLREAKRPNKDNVKSLSKRQKMFHMNNNDPSRSSSTSNI